MAAQTKQQPHAKRFLRPRVTADKVGLSIGSLYRKAAEGTFPKPVKISARASAWIEDEVDAYMAGRVEASREGGV
jgi:prophage regulatory protein